MQSYGAVGFSDDEFGGAIQAKYGNDEEKLSYASQIGQIAAEYTRVSKMPSASKMTRKERRAKRRAYRRECKEYLTAQAKEKVHPVGFIETFIFWAILSGIISWMTQLLMKKYFEEEAAELDESGE